MKVYAEGRAPDAPQITGLGELTPPTTKASTRKGAAGWAVPAALILLVVIPLATGALRLSELAGGPKLMPANAQFVATPLPVVEHIVGAGVHAILGAFQFVTGFRRRWPGWHRVAGRLLVLCGLLVGLSGLWMTLFFTRPGGAHEILYAFRLLIGSAMVGSIILGFAAIRRGDVTGHRAWMMRAYAIGLGTGTRVLTLMAGSLVVGTPSKLGEALLTLAPAAPSPARPTTGQRWAGSAGVGAGWVINLAVAEWAIRRRPPTQPAPMQWL